MRIAFYSYKGGTGRTMLLANIAVYLANIGKRVGCIDLDLEAPGIKQVFEFDNVEPNFSLIPLIENQNLSAVEKAVLKFPADKRKKKFIYVLPTLSMSEELDKIVFDQDTYDTIDGIMSKFEKTYNLDYLLIDSRSGFSSLASIVLAKSDRIIIVFRPDLQNLEGVKNLIQILDINNKSYSLIPSLIPRHKKEGSFLKRAEKYLECKNNWLGVIHYDPDIAIEGVLSIMHYPKKKISREYGEVASKII